MLVVLGGVVLIGGGRRLLQAWQARKTVARLGEPDVTAGEIETVDRFGRAGLHELFRIFGEAPSAPLREAAGRAIASLWAQDQLIAEEEQALVRRGYAVDWQARRRYPRALRSAIPITVTYGLPFLKEDGPGVKPANLEWSHRVTGARRAALEEYSPWTPGAGRISFSIVPGDFDSNGPHKLVLQTRVRTVGLTDTWQIDLPHIPFAFEFDPRLEVGSLLASPDDARGEVMGRSVRLEAPDDSEAQSSRFLVLNEAMTLRHPPRIVLESPLPCDLAHTVAIEFEGIGGSIRRGPAHRERAGGASRQSRRSSVGTSLLRARSLRAMSRARPSGIRGNGPSAPSSRPTLSWAGPTPTSAPSGRGRSRRGGSRSRSSGARAGVVMATDETDERQIKTNSELATDEHR